MEHLIRIAFWIVTLAGCLSAKSIPKGITTPLRTEVNCTGVRLYAPENVKKECITKGLDCFMMELLGRAKLECEDQHGYINQPLEVLDKLITARKTHKNSTECALECEQWEEVPFDKFLTNLDSLFQQVNSEA